MRENVGERVHALYDNNNHNRCVNSRNMYVSAWRIHSHTHTRAMRTIKCITTSNSYVVVVMVMVVGAKGHSASMNRRENINSMHAVHILVYVRCSYRILFVCQHIYIYSIEHKHKRYELSTKSWLLLLCRVAYKFCNSLSVSFHPLCPTHLPGNQSFRCANALKRKYAAHW